jgi:ribosomal protein S27AE
MLKAEFKKKVLLLDRNSDKSAEWEHCPRCVKGNMYPEYEDEHVCLQCGYRHYIGLPTDMPGLLKCK